MGTTGLLGWLQILQGRNRGSAGTSEQAAVGWRSCSGGSLCSPVPVHWLCNVDIPQTGMGITAQGLASQRLMLPLVVLGCPLRETSSPGRRSLQGPAPQPQGMEGWCMLQGGWREPCSHHQSKAG